MQNSFLHHLPPAGVMGCGAAKATGLGFVCFVVIIPRVLSANSVELGVFCFINCPFTPPPQAHVVMATWRTEVTKEPSESADKWDYMQSDDELESIIEEEEEEDEVKYECGEGRGGYYQKILIFFVDCNDTGHVFLWLGIHTVATVRARYDLEVGTIWNF